jgi:hypothetical protein
MEQICLYHPHQHSQHSDSWSDKIHHFVCEVHADLCGFVVCLTGWFRGFERSLHQIWWGLSSMLCVVRFLKDLLVEICSLYLVHCNNIAWDFPKVRSTSVNCICQNLFLLALISESVVFPRM